MLFNLKVLLYLDVLLAFGLVAFRSALLPQFRDVVGGKSVVLVLATPAVALLVGNIYAFHLYLACVVAFTSRTRLELCGTYLLMLPMIPALQLDLRAGSAYLLMVTSFTAMNAGVLAGIMLTKRRVRRTDLLMDVSVMLLVLIFIFMEARGAMANATTIARVILQNLLLLVPPYLLVSRSAADAQDVRLLLLYLCLAALLGSVVAVFGAIRHWDLYEPFYGALGVDMSTGSSALAVRGGRMRMGGPLVNYTAFGLFLAVVLVALPSLRGAFRGAGFAGVAAGLLAGLLSTQSRGAWVGLLVGFAVLQWLRGRRGAAAAVVGGGALAYGSLGAVLAPASQLAETLGASGEATGTGEYRRRLLGLGLDQVRAHPWTGQSSEQVTERLSALVQGQHIVDFVNTHLYVAMTAGVFAFAAWVAIWAVAMARVAARRRWGSAEVRRSGILLVPVAIIAATLVSLTFTSAIDRNLFWLLLAAGFATPFLAGAAPRRLEAGTSPPVELAAEAA